MEQNENVEKPKNQHPEQSWRDLPATPNYLAQLFTQQQLPESAWKPAHQFAGLIPSRKDWLRFIDLIMLGMGTIFLLAGIVFFFAFNWDDLTRFYRFAIVEGAVIVATILAFILNIDKWAGRLALAASAILLGVALAVVGQEYQTGADSYRLFMIWTLLITGWVLISRWNIMYLIWMILLNVTITLYWDQIVYSDWGNLNLILLTVNASFVFLWDSVGRLKQVDFMTQGRWFLYLPMSIAITHGTILMIDYVFGSNLISQASLLIPFAYLLLMGLNLAMYVIVQRDLFMVTLSALSVLFVTISGIGNTIFETDIEPLLLLLLMAIITISLTAGMAFGLRRLNKIWEVQDE